jgi:hypothetical protein
VCRLRGHYDRHRPPQFLDLPGLLYDLPTGDHPMSTLLGLRANGAHRRTHAVWQHLTEALADAVAQVADLGRQLAAEREQRRHADALMGRLVESRQLAEDRAEAAEKQAAAERERAVRAGDVIRDLRRQLAEPAPMADTVEMPLPRVVSLGSPLWREHAGMAS